MTTVCPSTRHSSLVVPFVSRWFLFTQKTAASSRRPELISRQLVQIGVREPSQRDLSAWYTACFLEWGGRALPKNRELAHKIEKYLKTIFLIHIRRTPAPRLLYPSISEQQSC